MRRPLSIVRLRSLVATACLGALVVSATFPSDSALAQPAAPKKPQPTGKEGPKKPAPDDPKKPTLKPGIPRRPLLPIPAKPGDPKDAEGKGKDKPKDDKPKDDKSKDKKPAVVEEDAPADLRWTHGTADAMIDQALKRAEFGTVDAVAGVLVALALRDHASPDRVSRGLGALTKSPHPFTNEARLLHLWMTPLPLGRAWEGFSKAKLDAPAQATGIVKTVAITGPFQDAGGGLFKQEGPEAPESSFADMRAEYSWGDYEVRVRRALPDAATAQGVPLDLYVSPRTESCSYVSASVTFPSSPKTVVARVAASGSVRLAWDGETVASSEEVHSRGILDRLAVAIDPEAGAHLVTVKVCSSPLPDDGRVRIRFTDEDGAPIRVEATSDLSGLPEGRAKAKPLAATAKPAKAGAKPAPTAKAPKATASRVKARRVQTALERALAVGTDPPTRRALPAVVVLALGGADDTRSPRAPGLLDRIAKDPTTTPDQLAVAGWLSGFGANKSGWLNQATERGLASGDRDTASFALRRLAEAQVAQGNVDWALKTLEREPLKGATDANARMLRASVKARAGGEGARLAALADLRQLDDDLKRRAPVAALRELVALSSSRPELRLGYARRLASAANDGRSVAFANAAAIEGSAAFEATAATLVAHQTNADGLVNIGRQLLSLERYAWAREVLYTATQLSPNEADGWEALAQAREGVILAEKAAGAPPSDSQDHAQAARRRALDLRRGDPRIQSELAFRDRTGPKPADTSEHKPEPDERFLVPSATIVERAKKAPAKVGEVFERQLHFQRVVTYHADKRVSQLIHQAREIVVEPRTPNELVERNIPQEGDQIELVFARLHRADGTVVQPEEQSAAGAYIKWPDLKKGDVVEYAVRAWTSGPVGRRGDAPFYFIDYVGSTTTRPVLFNEVIVDSPESSPLGLDVINGKAEKQEEKVENGRKIVRLTWDSPTNVADEPFSPRPTELLPLVVGSTFRSWDEFRAWYREAIKGFSEPDDQIKRLAADLTKGKKSEKEKLEAVFNYVADDIRYVNYVSGEYWLPNRPQQCLARKQGDCDDKATLLIALLRAIGVEATPVLVQTRITAMPSVLMGTKAAVPLFDHGIAYLPGKNGKPGTWLDATSPQSRIGPLPSMDARAKALFILEGDAKIIDTPSSSPVDHGVTMDWTIKLDATGAADVVGKEKHLGDWAFELRNNLVEADARAQWVEQYLSSRWLPTVDLAPKIDYVPDAGTLGYSARSEGFARKEGEELAVPVLGTYSFMATFAALPKRTLPLVLPPQLGPSHQKRTITLLAPPGFAFRELPAAGEAKGGPFGTAKVSFKPGKQNGSVIIESEVVFDKSTISVAEYPAFRKWLESVDALMRKSVRLGKGG